jgi:uncharacterized membrane protein YbhN (UPF0104 family)
LIQEKATTQPRTRRRYSAVAVFAFLSLIIILSWRYYSKFQWQLFFRTLESLDPRWVAAGAALALASYLGRAMRWKVMMLPAHSSFRRLISATLMGFSAVVLLGRAGEVVRPVLIARQEKSTVPAQLAVWLMERLYDLLLILVLFGIGLAEAGSLSLAPNSRRRGTGSACGRGGQRLAVCTRAAPRKYACADAQSTLVSAGTHPVPRVPNT